MVAEVLEFSGLGDFVYLPFKNYSSGMQARLCLSLLTCQPSQLLILDEVFESADQFFREKMSQRMLRLTEESDSVLFVSHSPDQIRRICNRVIVIEGGQIAYDGNVEGGLQFYEDLMPKKH
jgi:ABC-type polysaccharide/polyol phosphate transport system ATPase subunit